MDRIIAWLYNELAADLDQSARGFDIHFSGPQGTIAADSTVPCTVLIDDELIKCDSWDQFVDLEGTSCGASATTPSNAIRGFENTQATRHFKDTPVWFRLYNDELKFDQLSSTLAAFDDAEPAAVFALAADGAGGFFLGGSFAAVGGIARDKLAHISHSGTVSSLAPVVAGGDIQCLAYDPIRQLLLLGGSFATIDGNNAVRLASYNLVNGNVYDFDCDSRVTAIDLDIDSGEMYVLGQFASVMGETRNRAAKIRYIPGSEELLGWNPNLNGDALSISRSSDTAYIGGAFTTAAGVTRNRVAAFDLEDGLLKAWNPNASATVNAVLWYKNKVYLGGAFTTVSGSTRNRIARVNENTGLVDSWDPDADDVINAIIQVDNHILAVGDFTTINSVGRAGGALIDILDFDIAAWDPAATVSVYAVCKSNRNIGVATDFVGADGFGVFNAEAVNSSIGRFRFELIADPTKSIDYVVWNVFDTTLPIDNTDTTNSVYSMTVEEGKVESDGIHFTGPDIVLTSSLGFGARATIYYKDGSYSYVKSTHTPSISFTYLIPDGQETGDMYDSTDSFAAPTVTVLGNTYTVETDVQTGSPTTTNTIDFYRLYAIYPATTAGFDGVWVTWGGIANRDEIAFSPRRYYTTRVYTNTTNPALNNAAYTLTVRIRELGADLDTKSIASHPGSDSDEVFPDQVQIERQTRIATTASGPMIDRYATDWVAAPGHPIQFVYANQGPATYEFRYRYRYRDFRRDGTSLEKGPISVTSQWSSWSAWV